MKTDEVEFACNSNSILSKDIDYEKLPQRKILCIDMKSFFASVEAVERGLDPMTVKLAVVGDKTRKGTVVLAASQLLKSRYNIRTGNRLFEIPDVPEIKIVNARMGLYLYRSLEITFLLKNFVPLDSIHVYSIDESWLKLDGTEKIYGCSQKLAEKIREALLKKYALPVSMGIGPNMFLAKVAMDIEGKKNGLACWTYEDVPQKLWPVKLKDCWGIGSRLGKFFSKRGISTVGDLACLSHSYLEKKFGIMGSQLYYHARGIDLSKVEGHYQDKRKSLGRGITLFKDYDDLEAIQTVIFELAEEAGGRARRNNLAGRTVFLGLGYSSNEQEKGFKVQKTVENYTNSTFEIYQIALVLLEENYRGEKVRKISVSLGKLAPSSSIHLSLFKNCLQDKYLYQTKDILQDKYGYKALFFGRSLKKGSVTERVKTTIGGHGV